MLCDPVDCSAKHSTQTAARQVFLSFTVSWSLQKFMSIESGMLYNHPVNFLAVNKKL